MRKYSALLALAAISLTLNPRLSEAESPGSAVTTTPIKHLVVIFDENTSLYLQPVVGADVSGQHH
jgi:phospholipase C